MKITRLQLVIAVAGFYGCSDKEDATSGEEKTWLLEKAGQLGGELADKVKQGATEVGETASASLGKVADNVDETVDSVKQMGSQAAESVVDTASKKVESMSREAAAGDDTIDPDQIAMGKTIYEKTVWPVCGELVIRQTEKLHKVSEGNDTRLASNQML